MCCRQFPKKDKLLLAVFHFAFPVGDGSRFKSLRRFDFSIISDWSDIEVLITEKRI